jgi:hypothetical protein
MQTRLRYLPDETLHSFIFRVCLVNGNEKLADITDTKTLWRKNLQLNTKIMQYFTEYNDHDLLTLMRNSEQAKQDTKIFSNPVQHMSDIKRLLRKEPPKKWARPGGQLKYCIDCIKNSIREFGFGYFKSPWHAEVSGYCFIHKKSLSHYPAHSQLKPHEVLKTILRGQHPIGSYSRLSTSKTTQEQYRLHSIYTFNERTLPYDDGNYIFISGCLRAEIENFIRSCPDDLPKVSLISECFNKSIISKPYNEGYIFKNYILSKILRSFFEENFEPFLDFWQKNAVKKTVYCGVVKFTDLFEYLHIYQSTDKCIMCKHLSCPIKNHPIQNI